MRESLSVHLGWGQLYQEAKKELNLDSSCAKWRTTPSKRLFLDDLRDFLHVLKSSDQAISFISQCAKNVGPFTFGCFSLLFWTSPCLRTALKHTEDYSIIMSNPIHIQLQAVSNDGVELWFIDNETASPNAAVSPLGILLYILTLAGMIQKVSKLPTSAMAIELATSEFTHQQLDMIKQASNISIITGKTQNKLFVPRHYLQVENLYYDKDIYYSQHNLVREQASLLKSHDIILAIFGYFDSVPDLSMVSVETTSTSLALSVRTLNRKLNNQNTSYRRVFNNYRLEKSLRLLSDYSLNITEIAFRLGFSDVSAFSRAFKSWTGNSPVKFRCI